jgi:hypothetical protein
MTQSAEQWAITLTMMAVFLACWVWLMRRWRRWRKRRAIFRAHLIKAGIDKDDPRLKSF